MLSKEAVIEDDDVESTMTERRILAMGTQSPFLARLEATFQTEAHLYFVMEFITGGDLMFHIQKAERFKEVEARFMVAEICLGLFFLHEHGIIYRDLKLDNIMFDHEGHVKITDFGLSKEGIWGSATTTTFCGTPGYLAPEILHEQPYTSAVDWWSLGVLMYEMLVGNSPFEADDQDELFDLIQNAEIEYPAIITAKAKECLQGFLTRLPTKRLGCGTDGSENIKKMDVRWGGGGGERVSGHVPSTHHAPSLSPPPPHQPSAPPVLPAPGLGQAGQQGD